MGNEQRCTVRYGEEVSQGKATLETRDLRFRGSFRLDIPLDDITAVEVEGSELRLGFRGVTAAFDLGPPAATWAERIRNPRSRLDKLGVQPGLAIAALSLRDDSLLAELRQRAGSLITTSPRQPVDVIFLGLDHRNQSRRPGLVRWYLRRTGALWLVRLKGSAVLSEAEVIAAGRAAGMVDAKVVGLSETHSALKFVFPARR